MKNVNILAKHLSEGKLANQNKKIKGDLNGIAINTNPNLFSNNNSN